MKWTRGKNKKHSPRFYLGKERDSRGINRNKNNIKGDTSLMKTTNSVLDIVEFEVLRDKTYPPDELKYRSGA